MLKHITTTDAGIGRAQGLALLRAWYLGTPRPKGSPRNRCAA